MQVSVEKINAVERRLTITVPVNEVNEAYVKQINQYQKQAHKGFRPGKAPLSYIEQRFGAEARKEALGEIMQKAFYEAISENHLKPVNAPSVEPKLAAPDQPFEFIASFEILPELEKINFTMDKLEKLIVEVKDDDIHRVLEKLCKQHAKWNVIDQPAKDKNRVVIDYYAIYEGKEDQEHKVADFPLELGSKVMIPGFEEGLMGVIAGDERKLNLHFPADFGVAERASKPVDFIVKVKQVYEAHIPQLDEVFIKKLGIASGKEEDLQAQIRQSLEQERDRLIREKLKEQVFRHLLEQNPVETPKSLVSQEMQHIHNELYPQHQPHDHHEHSEQEMVSFTAMASKRVALGILIAEYARHHHLKADKEQVFKRIIDIASSYENPKEVAAWLSSKERLGGIETQVLEDQVLEKLIENISATEKIMSYADLTGIHV